MRIISTGSVLFLALIFLYAGIDKLLHYGGFVNALSSYAVIPAELAPSLAPAVILAEIGLGLGLLRRRWRERSALAGATLLAAFTLVLGIHQLYAPGSECGCWFTLTLARGSGMHIVQNLVLIALALTVWWQPRAERALPA